LVSDAAACRRLDIFLRRMGAAGVLSNYQKNYLELARRQAEALERIATLLEKRS
jgi:hypothetical protein